MEWNELNDSGEGAEVSERCSLARLEHDFRLDGINRVSHAEACKWQLIVKTWSRQRVNHPSSAVLQQLDEREAGSAAAAETTTKRAGQKATQLPPEASGRTSCSFVL